MKRAYPITLAAILALITNLASAAISIPPDTRVYLETKEVLIGKKGQVSAGQMVRCQVWRDVLIDGEVVIAAGTPAMAKVDSFKTRKVAGIKGKMTLAALETESVDHQNIQLAGGYNKEGKGRIAMAASLSALVAWPLIFIPGKAAELPDGTVFDAYTTQRIAIGTQEERRPPVIDLTGTLSSFEVAVLYDELAKQEKPKNFDFLITAPSDAPESFVIDRINGAPTKPVELEVVSVSKSDQTSSVRASAKIKVLAKRFKKGINTMEVAYLDSAGERRAAEVILDLQF